MEKIGPVSAITSSVDGVESMQVYYSQYLPGLFYSLLAPICLFFQLWKVSLAPAVLLFLVSFLLLPVNNIFRRHIETLKTQYWFSMEDLTGYYMESVQGITTFKLFGRDGHRQAVLAEKSRNFNDKIMEVMKVNFSSFLLTDGLIYGAVAVSTCIAAGQLTAGAIPFFQRADGAAAVLWVFRLGAAVDERHPLCLGRCVRRGQGGKTAGHRHHPPLRPRPAGREGTLSRHPHGACVLWLSRPGGRPAGRDLGDPQGEGDGPGGAFRQREVHHRLLAHAFLRLGERPHPVRGPGPGQPYPGGAAPPGDLGAPDGEPVQRNHPENLRMAAPSATDGELLEALDQVRLKEWVLSQPEGLDTFVGDAGGKLSGGQRQKMGIARALLCRAEYILFDEATSSVDRDSEQEIWNCIGELAQTRTLLIISHRLSTIRDADVIYVLEKGQVSQRGSHRELMAQPGLYRRLVEEQAQLEQQGEEECCHG